MNPEASGYSSPDTNDKSMITTPGDEGITALLERQITNQLHEVEKILLPILRNDQARIELSTSQKLLLAACMTCTTTITVSPPTTAHDYIFADKQGATNSASNINIPSAAADLEISQLAAQWVRLTRAQDSMKSLSTDRICVLAGMRMVSLICLPYSGTRS